MTAPALRRLGLAVHPRRDLDRALATVRRWADAHGADVVQIAPSERRVAEPGAPADCDVLLALGGDGTALAALRAAVDVPVLVLGVACGSLGALTTTSAADLAAALDALAAGRWRARVLPGLAVRVGDAGHETAVNDLVVVRRGANQAMVDVRVDGALYARFGGDGVIVATPTGSSAYTLAAGGPLLAGGAEGLVVTPLAPHGGSIPPLVVGPASTLRLDVDGGHGGARLELDGRVLAAEPTTLELTWRPDHATLVELDGPEPLLQGLRRRGLIADSPRVAVRDGRVAPVSGSSAR